MPDLIPLMALVWLAPVWSSAATTNAFPAPRSATETASKKLTDKNVLQLSLRAEEVTVLLSQTYQNTNRGIPEQSPADSTGYTNYGGRVNLTALALLDLGIFRFYAGLGWRHLDLSYFDALGVAITNSFRTADAFSFEPGFAVKLLPLYLGVEFHGLISTNQDLAKSDFWDLHVANPLSLRAFLDQRIFRLPVYLLAAVDWNRDFTFQSPLWNLSIDTGLRFNFNYYISFTARYKFFLGRDEGAHYLNFFFDYQLSPNLGFSLGIARLMYRPGASPATRVNAGVNVLLDLSPSGADH
ncbi:MAG: hypothetical protein JNM63_16045 [Spirochaetia bacterium]|nr:hypothetical protein [Spirochaetia bacterium]